MSPARLTTALFGCALTLVFFFGNIAPGLAYETYPGGSVASIRLDFNTAHRLSRLGAPAFNGALIAETCDPVTPASKALATRRMFETPEIRTLNPLIFTRSNRPKVSRHLLEAILLI